MLIDYDPIILSVLIRVSHQILAQVKSEIIKAALKLETDDRAYVYAQNDYTILRRRGMFIAKVANYIPQPIRLDHALEQIVQILAREDKKTLKYVFLILNHFDIKEEHDLIKGMALDLQADTDCNFIFCDLEKNSNLRQVCTTIAGRHPRCKYLQIDDMETLGQTMIDIYYPEEERTVIDKEFKDKYGKTPAEARQELKEKYENRKL